MTSLVGLLRTWLVTCFIVKCFGNEKDSESPIVRVSGGLVKGTKDTSLQGNEFYSFVGIPYAKPPTGDLRFKDPIPPDPWEDIRGSEMAPYCPQYRKFGKMDPQPYGEEDCLYLNVFTPQPKVDAHLPVMVFIHGGAFLIGGAKDYTPHVLMNEDIVFVVLQYRLGIFGFLSTEDIVIPGNMGLKDQQMALKWVHNNIIHFGGDPGRVTLFGESTGGASAHMQIFSPGSEGLFQRVIAQSGNALCPWSKSVKHRQFARAIGKKFGCPVSEGSESYLACMQKADIKGLLLSATETIRWGLGPLHVIPRIDGNFFPDTFEVLLKEKRYNKVDLISGITKHEGGLLMTIAEGNPRMLEGLKKNFEKVGPLSLLEFGEPMAQELAKEAYEHYLGKDPSHISPQDNEQLLQLYSDFYFGLCHDEAANSHVHHAQGFSVYLYELDHPGQRSLSDFQSENKKKWVSHGDDLFYLFSGGHYSTFKPLTKEEDLRLRDLIVSLWTNFARTGNPTPPGSNFTWERATPRDFRHLSLAPSPKMLGDNFSRAREFWSSAKSKHNKTEKTDTKSREEL